MNVEKESVKKKKKKTQQKKMLKKKKTFFQPPLYHRFGIVGGGDQWNNFLYFYPQLKFKKFKKKTEKRSHKTQNRFSIY